MLRVQFTELHEQPWFPSSLRDGITDALQFGFNLFKVYSPIAPLLQSALDSTRSRSIVDLCSGGGGPWLDLSRKLQSRKLEGEPPVLQIWLTDKYPNLRAFENVKTVSENHIAFYPGPVDAMKVPLAGGQGPPGVRSLTIRPLPGRHPDPRGRVLGSGGPRLHPRLWRGGGGLPCRAHGMTNPGTRGPFVAGN